MAYWVQFLFGIKKGKPLSLMPISGWLHSWLAEQSPVPQYADTLYVNDQ